MQLLPCSVLITIANRLNPDQAQQKVGPDQDSNCLTQLNFQKKSEKKSADNKKALNNYPVGRVNLHVQCLADACFISFTIMDSLNQKVKTPIAFACIFLLKSDKEVVCLTISVRYTY